MHLLSSCLQISTGSSVSPWIVVSGNGSSSDPIFGVSGSQPSVRPNALNVLRRSFSMLSCGSQVQCPYMPSNPREQVPSLGSSPFTLPGSSVRIANSSSSDKITCLAKDEAIYMKVFMEVDMDRDGKITG